MDLSEFISIFIRELGKSLHLEAQHKCLVPALVALALVGIYSYFRVDSKMKEAVNKFPGPAPLPFVGNIVLGHVPTHEIIGIAKNLFSTYGKTIRAWVGPQPYIFTTDPNIIEKVLASDVHIEKSHVYRFFVPWIGDAVGMAKGNKWRNRRQMLAPTFHLKLLENFMEVFNEQSMTLVQILDEKAGTGEAFQIFPYITRCALDIICETVMGKKVHAQQDTASEYVMAVLGITDLVFKRMIRPWLRPDFCWNLSAHGRQEKKLLRILHGFTEGVIAERRLERKQISMETSCIKQELPLGKRHKAFLDLLFDARDDEGRCLSDLEIREEADIFMAAGHDTSAASTHFTIFLLASNPKCQKHVLQELRDIFGEDQERLITSTDLTRMKYLECCIKESLRLCVSTPFFGRSIDQDVELGDGRVIPKGIQLFILPFILHRDPDFYKEPEKFLPERFLPENRQTAQRHPYTYIPFSAGPRNCLGQKFALMETKLVLAQMFRKFRVETRQKLKDIKLAPEIILRAKEPVYVTLTKLNPKNNAEKLF